MRLSTLIFIFGLAMCAKAPQQPTPEAPSAGSELVLAGTYAVETHLDLSDLLGESRSTGSWMRELIIGEVVEQSKVSEKLRPRLRMKTGKAIGDRILKWVDQNNPGPLRPTGGFMRDIQAILSEVTIRSTLTIEEKTDTGIHGTETLESITVRHKGSAFSIPLRTALPAGTVTRWKAKRTGARSLRVDPHGPKLAFGEIVKWIIANAMEEPDFVNTVAHALDCEMLLDGVMGGKDGPILRVGSQRKALTVSVVRTACLRGRSQLAANVLGKYHLALVEAGGKVHLEPGEEGEVADALRSDDSFGGPVWMTPAPSANKRLKVQTTFTADAIKTEPTPAPDDDPSPSEDPIPDDEPPEVSASDAKPKATDAPKFQLSPDDAVSSDDDLKEEELIPEDEPEPTPKPLTKIKPFAEDAFSPEDEDIPDDEFTPEDDESAEGSQTD